MAVILHLITITPLFTSLSLTPPDHAPDINADIAPMKYDNTPGRRGPQAPGAPNLKTLQAETHKVLVEVMERGPNHKGNSTYNTAVKVKTEDTKTESADDTKPESADDTKPEPEAKSAEITDPESAEDTKPESAEDTKPESNKTSAEVETPESDP